MLCSQNTKSSSTNAISDQDSESIPQPKEPPFPRNYLLALAIKNVSPEGESPVPMSKLWGFIINRFPYFELSERWSLNDLLNDEGFKSKSEFVLNEDGDDFLVTLNPDRAEKLFEEVSDFTKKNILAIQNSMRMSDSSVQ